MSSRIKDINEFCKLFRVRIPVEAHFDYYIETLAKSKEFAWVPEKVEAFAELEEQLGDETTIGDFKMEQLAKLKRVMTSTNTFQDFMLTDYRVPSRRKDGLANHGGSFLLSVDIYQANYAIFSAFDIYEDFPESWSQLCEEEEINSLLASSKAWRQLVFGNMNPKRNQRFQQVFLQSFIDLLKPLGVTDDHIISLTADEAILTIGMDLKEAAQNMQAVSLMANMIVGPDCSDSIPEPFRGKLKLNLRPFRLETINKGAYLREKYTYEDGEMEFSHKSLYGVPGNQYYYHLKTDILDGELDKRDLLFMNDHRLAKWVMDPDAEGIPS